MGIDSQRFVGVINREFICTICEDVFRDPVQTKCEHIFCLACIESWLFQVPTCPIDRTPTTLAALTSVPRVFKNLLGSLELQCKFSGYGCEAVASLNSMDSHLLDCSFNPEASCPLKCGFVFSKDGSGQTAVPPHPCLEDKLRQKESEIEKLRLELATLKNENESLRRQSVASSTVDIRGRDEQRAVGQSTDAYGQLVAQSDGATATPGNWANWVSEQHKRTIIKLDRSRVIKSNAVYAAMISVDLFPFYRASAYNGGWDEGHAANLSATAPFINSSLKNVAIVKNYSGYFQICFAKMLPVGCALHSYMGETASRVVRGDFSDFLTSGKIKLAEQDHSYAVDGGYELIVSFEPKLTQNYSHLLKNDGIKVNAWSQSFVMQKLSNGNLQKVPAIPFRNK